jgi:excisionase family DNA binding protein
MGLVLFIIGALLYWTSKFSFGSIRAEGRHVKAAGAVLMFPAAGAFVLSFVIGMLFNGDMDALLSLIGFLSFVEFAAMILSIIVAYILVVNPRNAPRLPGILGEIQAEAQGQGSAPAQAKPQQPARKPHPLQAYHNPAPAPTAVPKIMSLKQAAEYMRVSEAEITRWIDEGKLAAARINYRYSIAKSALDDLRETPPEPVRA